MRIAIPLAALLLLAASPLHAQRDRRGMTDTTEWLDDCRSGEHRWSDDDRARGCEVRRTAIAAPKGHVSIDAGENGGISVIGGDADSMIVVARIATTGDNPEQAIAIARQIRIEVTATSVRASGPSSRGPPALVRQLRRRAPARRGRRGDDAQRGRLPAGAEWKGRGARGERAGVGVRDGR